MQWYLWRLERIICWKSDGQEENASCVHSIGLKKHIRKPMKWQITGPKIVACQ